MSAAWLAVLLAAAGPRPDGGVLSAAAAARPLRIEAERLEVLARENLAVYRGKAKATRDQTTITCDELRVFYTGQLEQEGQREVSRVEARGNVEVQDGAKWARGDRADFDNRTGVLVATGNPEARVGRNRVAGSRVTFTVETDVIDVEDAKTVLEDTAAQRPAHREVFIQAPRLRVLGHERQAIWSGGVRARREQMDIRSQRLVARYAKTEELTHVEATGRVEVQDKERWATGERADFDNQTGVLVVTGNPEAREGPNRMRGSRVTFVAGSDQLLVEDAQTVIDTRRAPNLEGKKR